MSEKTYVYSPSLDNNALDLCRALDATRLRRFDGMHFWAKGKRLELPEGSAIINWGGLLPDIDGFRVLNGGALARDQKGEHNLLLASVSVPPVYSTRPWRTGMDEPVGIIPRTFNQGGAKDFISPPTNPDYWTQKLKLNNEYRVHIFDQKAIRAGKKVLRPDYVLAGSVEEWRAKKAEGALIAHPWVKSYETGWTVTYENMKSGDVRSVAKGALATLGLTFGSVDIGDDDYTRYTFGVNKTPAVHDEGTLAVYIKAIKRWLAKEAVVEETVVEEVVAGVAAAPAQQPAFGEWVFQPALQQNQFLRYNFEALAGPADPIVVEQPQRQRGMEDGYYAAGVGIRAPRGAANVANGPLNNVARRAVANRYIVRHLENENGYAAGAPIPNNIEYRGEVPVLQPVVVLPEDRAIEDAIFAARSAIAAPPAGRYAAAPFLDALQAAIGEAEVEAEGIEEEVGPYEDYFDDNYDNDYDEEE